MAKFNFTANIARPRHPHYLFFYSEVSDYRVMVRRVYTAAVKWGCDTEAEHINLVRKKNIVKKRSGARADYK